MPYAPSVRRRLRSIEQGVGVGVMVVGAAAGGEQSEQGDCGGAGVPAGVLAELADRGFPFAEIAERGLAVLGEGSPVTADTLEREIAQIRKIEDLKTGRCPWYRNDLLSPRSRRELLDTDVERLAAACAPRCIAYAERPPALWGPADWAALADQQAAEPLFDMDEVRRQHAEQRHRFREDGFCGERRSWQLPAFPLALTSPPVLQSSKA